MTLHHELVSKGYRYSLTQLSTMAANAWKHESVEAKQAYIDLVNDAKVLYREISLKEKSNTTVKNTNYKDNNNLGNGADLRNINIMTTIFIHSIIKT